MAPGRLADHTPVYDPTHNIQESMTSTNWTQETDKGRWKQEGRRRGERGETGEHTLDKSTSERVMGNGVPEVVG